MMAGLALVSAVPDWAVVLLQDRQCQGGPAEVTQGRKAVTA